jgi:hypothetical protein
MTHEYPRHGLTPPHPGERLSTPSQSPGSVGHLDTPKLPGVSSRVVHCLKCSNLLAFPILSAALRRDSCLGANRVWALPIKRNPQVASHPHRPTRRRRHRGISLRWPDSAARTENLHRWRRTLWTPRSPRCPGMPFWPSDYGRRSSARKATASAPKGSRTFPRAAPLPGRCKTPCPDLCTPRPSCRPESPVPQGKQERAAVNRRPPPLTERY